MATIIAPVIPPPKNDGIRNNFMNCWLSALLQMMVNWPTFNHNNTNTVLPLLQAQYRNYQTNNSFMRLLQVITVLNTILPELEREGHQYNLTAIQYNTIMDSLLPTQRPGDFQDFNESFQKFMELVIEVIQLDPAFFADIILVEFSRFMFTKKEVYYQCDDPSIAYQGLPNTQETVLLFYELNTDYITDVQELLEKSKEPNVFDVPKVVDGINYCSNSYNYNLNINNNTLLISFSNNRRKCIYPNPILFVSKDQRYHDGSLVPNQVLYIINGVICYTGAHYYYVSFDDNGTPLYEYDDANVSNVTDFNKIYTEMVFASYLIYRGNPARIPDFRQLMDIQLASLRDRFTHLPIDIVKKKELLEKKKELEKKLGIHSDYLQIQYYEEMIKLTEPPNPITTINWNNINTQFYTYFFTPIPNYDVGKYIVKSVPDQELYDLFYIGDSFKEKYTDSIEVNTEHFKDINQINTKPIDKEVDIENIYNAREQLFSSSKKKPMKKYSMFYYTNEF